MIIIALTLVVIAITLISQTYARRTINELVQVHSKIARLSLETENTLRVMQGYEKDFFLQHERIGIREAKEKYQQVVSLLVGKSTLLNLFMVIINPQQLPPHHLLYVR